VDAYSADVIGGFLLRCDDASATTTERGKALEDLICYLFECVPGVTVEDRNAMNVAGTEEIDVALWNDKALNGLDFLPNVILVEAKNWTSPVSSMEVAWFIAKLRNRGRDYGILVAMNGITGCPEERKNAYFEVASALKDKVQVIIVTRDDLLSLSSIGDLARLLKKKECQLVIRASF
jgi:hypothetical protein